MPGLSTHVKTFILGMLLAGAGLSTYTWWQNSKATAADLPTAVVYKSPTCGCCGEWVDHLRANGFAVAVEDDHDVAAVKEREGVPERLTSCHTALVGDYVVEGHVPASDIKRLLRENHEAAGLAVPGMPVGSPGMEQGSRRDPYDVLIFKDDGQVGVYSSHNQ